MVFAARLTKKLVTPALQTVAAKQETDAKMGHVSQARPVGMARAQEPRTAPIAQPTVPAKKDKLATEQFVRIPCDVVTVFVLLPRTVAPVLPTVPVQQANSAKTTTASHPSHKPAAMAFAVRLTENHAATAN
jgi:hypothetical protein